MPVSDVSEYGKVKWLPGGSSKTTYEEEGGSRATHYNLCVILGDGVKRGDPNPDSILLFQGPGKMREILGSGAVLNLAKKMWSPTPDDTIQGANWIGFIRVGTPVQASLDLTDGAEAVLTATAKDYGKDSNNIRVKVENGSVVTAAKKLTVAKIDDDGILQANAYDNLRDAFAMQYTGSGVTGTVTIATDGTGGSALTLATSIGGVTGDALSIDLTDANYSTIGKLVNYINGQPNYTATMNRYGDSTMPSSYLDAVTAQDIRTSEYTTKAVLGSIIHKINRDDPFITLARVTGKVAAPTNVYYQNLSGGYDDPKPSVDTQDYLNALTKLENYNLGKFYILVQSTLPAVLIAVAAWAKNERENDRGMKRVFAGHASSITSVDTMGATARLVNNIDCTFLGKGVRIYDENNVLQDYDSTYTAAMACGMTAGSPTTKPLTNKMIPISGIIGDFDNGDNEFLVQSGVLFPIWDQQRKFYKFAYGVTTHTMTDERFKCIQFLREEVDTVEYGVQMAIQNAYLGERATYATPKGIQAVALKALRGYEDEGILTRNPADPNSVAFTMPQITIYGGKVTCRFKGNYADEIDFVHTQQTAALQILESVVTAQIGL